MTPSRTDDDNAPAPSPAARAPAVRVDLHCHSLASSLTAEAVLNAIHCPECYSDPRDVHAQAKRRGMDFVAITDHDTIDGALAIAHRPDVIVGEEVTCWFPEDGCKMHVLVFGLTADDHAALQSVARDIYRVAAVIEERRLAHAVAHPIYRQNDKLERWHLERLLLLFKGFECLNGAHSPLHREAFEPLLEWLTRDQIEKLSAKHDLAPRWPEPWVKARTGGSDDHGLLNVGRTWTEFPPGTDTREKLLDCLRAGTCRPGGESGSSAKLAHTFYSVAVRYYGRHIMAPGMKPNLTTSLLRAIVGERAAPTKLALARAALRSKVRRIAGAVANPFRRKEPEKVEEGTSLLKRLFLTSFRDRLGEHPALRAALDDGLPPLGEHEEMVRLVNTVSRDVTGGLEAAIRKAFDTASFTALFEAIAAVVAQQFVLSPYYFSLFHQNKERHLLRRLAHCGAGVPPASLSDASCRVRFSERVSESPFAEANPATERNAGGTPTPQKNLRIGLFTDTLDDVNGVGRFLRDMATHAARAGRALTVHTCCKSPASDAPWRKNFAPLFTTPLPAYPELDLSLPPVLEVLEWADQQQFDVIHVSTPGPMGLCGLLAARMLRCPVVGTYHTDFPAYAERLTGDHRVANGTRAYVEWFYRRPAAVFSRSRAYEMNLRDLGVAADRIETLAPGVDTERFNPARRDPSVWPRLGAREPLRLLYCGRLSREKNLDLLVDAFESVCRSRRDVALVLAGHGPHEKALRARLNGLPAYLIGRQDDAPLAALYASSDLLVFPSTTDTLGQVVLEAQASGLPALVSTHGGPRELVEHESTGLVLNATDPDAWAHAITVLLAAPARRAAMSAAATRRTARYALANTFDQFWNRHAQVLRAAEGEAAEIAIPV